MGKGEKGGFGFGYSSHTHVHVAPVYYGRYRRSYGYGSYGAATGDCVCGVGPLHCLCCFAIAWLILMMVLTFATAPKARYSEDVYLEMTETRPYQLPAKASFVTSSSDVYGSFALPDAAAAATCANHDGMCAADKIGNVKFYQFNTLPALTGPIAVQNVCTPRVRRRPLSERTHALLSLWPDRWLYRYQSRTASYRTMTGGYWFNTGSFAHYTASCTNTVDFVVLDGDTNLKEWESIGSGDSYSTYYDFGVLSINYNHPPVSAGRNVYFVLSNPYYTVSTCTIRLSINYTTFDLSGHSPVLTGSGSLDRSDGWVIMVPPKVPDNRNIYTGADSFTVGADMYTVNVKQNADPAVMVGPMMGIFAGVCVLFMVCACVLVNGVPAACGGDPEAGTASADPTPPAATTNTTAATTSAAPPTAIAMTVVPASAPPQSVIVVGVEGKPDYPNQPPPAYSPNQPPPQ